jgi:hypothetical protein
MLLNRSSGKCSYVITNHILTLLGIAGYISARNFLIYDDYSCWTD